MKSGVVLFILTICSLHLLRFGSCHGSLHSQSEISKRPDSSAARDGINLPGPAVSPLPISTVEPLPDTSVQHRKFVISITLGSLVALAAIAGTIYLSIKYQNLLINWGL